jgi:hypothetical protein
MDYYTLGLSEPIMFLGNNALGYPNAQEVSTFGQLYVPRIYAKDVSVLEIASSGKMAVSLEDTHALDILKEDSNIFIGAKSNYSLTLANSNASSIVRIVGDTNDIHLTSSADIELRAASNVYVKGKKFIIDTEDVFSYTLNVNAFGDLEFLKSVTSNNTKVTKVVATFGRDRTVL